MLAASAAVRAQQCPKQMLSIPEEGGYVALKGDSLKLDKAMTVEAWVRLNSSADRSTIIEKGNIGTFINYSLALGPLNTVVARVLTPTGVVTLSSEFIPNISDWHHYAIVFKPGDSLYLYVDGERSAAVKVLAVSLSTGNDSLRIGKSVVSGGKNLYGSVDEVRLWKIARTQSEINTNKGSVVARSTPGLAAYLTFDDDAARGYFFENKGLVARLHRPALLVPSTSPVNGVPPAYKIQAKEAQIRFPAKSCVTKFDTIVHVRNLGLDSIHVNEMGLVHGTAFSIAGPERLDLPADSGFYGEIHIQFNPTGSGIYIDTLVIGSSSACAGQVRIPLIDTFTLSRFEIVQKQLTIPNILNCELPTQRTITVRNTGSTPIAINRVYFSTEIGMSASPTQFSLPVGGSRDIQIRIDRGADGFANSALVVESDVCQRMESIEVTISRETIDYIAPVQVDYGERMLLSDELVIDTIVSFTNSSTREIVISSASVTGISAFVVTPQVLRVAVQPGATIEIPIRFRATTCGTYVAALHIFGTPCAIDVAIPLRISVTGPKPTIASVIDMGFNCSSRDTTLFFTNPYDSTITLTGHSLSVPGVFQVLTTFPIRIAPNGRDSLKLRFNPTVDKEYAVDLTMTNAKCGSMVLKLLGGLGTKSLAVQPLVDFGRGCDLGPLKRKLAVTNNSPREAVIQGGTIAQSTRYRFVDDEFPLVVVPGETKEFTVEFMPEGGAITRGLAGFTLANGCKTGQAQLYGSREEPVLTIASNLLNFDTLCSGSSRTIDLLVSNDGLDSVDLEVSFASKLNDFKLAVPKPVLRKGSNVLQISFTPLANGSYLDTLVLTTPGCDVQYRIALQGTGGTDPELIVSNTDVQFGQIEVGTFDERCLLLSNPGCTPITLDASSFRFTDASFSLRQSTLDQLPRTIASGESFEICVVYRPDVRTTDASELQVMASGIETKVLQLTGQGIGPELSFTPLTLDFGFVPVGDAKGMNVRIENSGELPATLDISIPTSGFTSVTSSVIVRPNTFRDVEVLFTPSNEGAATAQMTFSGASQVVELVGVGSKRGLVIDHAAVNFGDVRVKQSKSIELKITANVAGTKLTDLKILNSPESKYYQLSASSGLPFAFAGDTLLATITFTPGEERDLLAMLEVTSTDQSITIPLEGRGVEAHIVTVAEIDFGTAELEVPIIKSYAVTNTGGFPLTISGTSATPPFEAAVDPRTIQPGMTETFDASFTALSKKEVIGELRISSDAAEGERVIRLRGKGGDGTQSVARIGYSVPDVSAVIGETVTVPVTIEGNKLDQFKADSFYIEFRYDPWMLYVHGFEVSNSVTNGLLATGVRKDDSTYAIAGRGSLFTLSAGAALVEIKGEALFGPRERTVMQVVAAYPSTASSLTEAMGLFRVTNCKDQTAAAIHKGAYSVEQAFPTPTNKAATIAYTLGFNGSAEIEIIDALGRSVKRVQLPEKPKGEHTFTLDVSDLPNGHYSGLFRSREFLKRIDLIVQH